ncbi:MAG: hypothetical protein Q8P05_04425 [Candidatus Diapherotrites archaeon]|nr:hypothetical protein [Candidatus Diapherotrites archaeon]MDZ4256117.1 hypothetical protein [archaeon]
MEEVKEEVERKIAIEWDRMKEYAPSFTRKMIARDFAQGSGNDDDMFRRARIFMGGEEDKTLYFIFYDPVKQRFWCHSTRRMEDNFRD